MGTNRKSARPGPTPIRFTAEDLEIIGELMQHYGLTRPAVLRMALRELRRHALGAALPPKARRAHRAAPHGKKES